MNFGSLPTLSAGRHACIDFHFTTSQHTVMGTRRQRAIIKSCVLPIRLPLLRTSASYVGETFLSDFD